MQYVPPEPSPSFLFRGREAGLFQTSVQAHAERDAKGGRDEFRPVRELLLPNELALRVEVGREAVQRRPSREAGERGGHDGGKVHVPDRMIPGPSDRLELPLRSRDQAREQNRGDEADEARLPTQHPRHCRRMVEV